MPAIVFLLKMFAFFALKDILQSICQANQKHTQANGDPKKIPAFQRRKNLRRTLFSTVER
jgi:hypothetical protein